MIRLRFHGRGGHGVKTASRMVGTAAFLAGYHVQDSPVYGAERRGAPIAAFTRIDSAPIRERGVIERPHIIVVADETLLDDPLAGVLAGQRTASAVFVNAAGPADYAARLEITAPLITYDITARALDVFGGKFSLSAALAGAAGKLAGVFTIEQLVRAVREELESIGVLPELIEKNIVMARELFEAVSPVTIRPQGAEVAGSVVVVPGHDATTAAPSILHAGNAALRHTGDWRVETPIINRDICTRCGLCHVQCPDGAISLDAEGYPVIDYEHCKGCMICAQLCPPKGIETRREVRAW